MDGEELDTIQTCTTDCTGMTLRIQDAVAVSITREWHGPSNPTAAP